MILIGRYTSPFARRVGVTLNLLGLEFEHRPLSVWDDAEALKDVNPLRRVPALVLDDGRVLVESMAIVDVLDDLVGPERALLPRTGPLRSESLRLDGFKGRSLDFRPWSGELRQPIHLAHPGGVVSVSPQDGFLHPLTELDTLGIDRPESRCFMAKR